MSIFDFLFARAATPEQAQKNIFLDAIDGGGRFGSGDDFRGGPLGISALLNALGVGRQILGMSYEVLYLRALQLLTRLLSQVNQSHLESITKLIHPSELLSRMNLHTHKLLSSHVRHAEKERY